MTLRNWIRENRHDIDAAIVRAYGENCKPANDDERAEWVRNDEGLYRWARSDGWRG